MRPLDTRYRAIALLATVAITACTDSSVVSPDVREPAASILEAVTSTDLTGAIATEVTPAPTVRLRHRDGSPAAGFVVAFDAAPGSGTVANTRAVSDAAGIATAGAWRLGTAPGIHTVTARSSALTDVVFRAAARAPGDSPAHGSVSGFVLGAGSGYPINGNGLPGERALGWPLLGIIASAPGQTTRWAHENPQTGSFAFEGLPAGPWTITFNGLHPWSAVFPGTRLYADTSLTVTVLPNQTLVLPEVAPRPHTLFMVATEICPFPVPNPPTAADWGNCDSGYWGGIEVVVQVQGVAGTATEGARYSASIARDRWHADFPDVVAGEYDVTIAPTQAGGAPFCAGGTWQLLPWQQPTVRLRVERGLAYAEFDYWCAT